MKNLLLLALVCIPFFTTAQFALRIGVEGGLTSFDELNTLVRDIDNSAGNDIQLHKGLNFNFHFRKQTVNFDLGVGYSNLNHSFKTIAPSAESEVIHDFRTSNIGVSLAPSFNITERMYLGASLEGYKLSFTEYINEEKVKIDNQFQIGNEVFLGFLIVKTSGAFSISLEPYLFIPWANTNLEDLANYFNLSTNSPKTGSQKMFGIRLTLNNGLW